MGDGYLPVIAHASLPNFTEQEIIAIDLTSPEPAEGPKGEKAVSNSAKDWWGSTKHGLIDPRPRAMAFSQGAFDRACQNGGIFIVFCEPRDKQDLLFASADQYGNLESYPQQIGFDNWSFLTVTSTDYIAIEFEHGTEIETTEDTSVISSFLRRHLEGAHFSAIIEAQLPLDERTEGPVFFPLLKNKYGAVVGGAIVTAKTRGLVLLLPHLKFKARAIHDLIAHVLPDIAPERFPFNEGTGWLTTTPYEHPHIISLVRKQDEIRAHADNEIERLDAEVAEERERLAFLHGILTKTGDSLVKDVTLALEALGFTKVIDVDEGTKEETAKQEDLQIHDARPILLAEVKGLNGVPTEGDTLQVVKYIPRRMKEWGHTEVSGVVIINHQRSIPPLDRRHDAVFTKQQNEDAENHDIVLVTTWELFRLVRGVTAFNWHPDVLRGLFYGKGRISPVPLHWKLVGHVVHFYDKAGAVSIELVDTLKVGDKIGFLLPSQYVEEDITSLQVEQEQVKQAVSGQRVGHKTNRTRAELRDGMPVYVIKQPGAE